MNHTQENYGDFRQYLQHKTVAVLGYGSQGRAQSLNLRDSGVNVVLGLREGGSWQRACADQWQPVPITEAVSQADVVAVLLPDMQQQAVYQKHIEPFVKPGATLLFSHGFAVHYRQIQVRSDLDLVLVAPKSPGQLVRDEYLRHRGVPSLYAVEQDVSGEAEQRALAYAQALGSLKAGVLKTSFKEETETDLFGEQAVLCGGVMELVKYGFETLTEAGYQPELAYFECLHELKLIVDLLYQGGFDRMHEFVSDTANFGALVSGKRVLDPQAKENMRQVLSDIQSGQFAKTWLRSHQQGDLAELIATSQKHPIEQVGVNLRQKMAWL